MAKVSITTIPPGYQELLDKILAHFDNMIYPTWATRFFHKTRSAKKANKEKTYLPSIASYWAALTVPEKAAWGTAAAFGTLNKYQLFTTDLSYRRKNGLSVPGTPNQYHEMMGLKIDNPAAEDNIYARRDEKDLVGPVSISFTYKKSEYPSIYDVVWSDSSYGWSDPLAPWGDDSPQWSDPRFNWSDDLVSWGYSPSAIVFDLVATLYYFDAGKNKTLTHTWTAPDGNVDWTQVSFSFGSSGQKYFHLTIFLRLNLYQVTILLDHFLVQTNGIDKYRENWQYKSGKTWVYDNLYRKTGWYFSPGYRVPYFNVIYLG